MEVGSAIIPLKEKPINFDVDHPFIFLIRHRITGTILFIGRINENPQREGLKKLSKEEITASLKSHVANRYQFGKIEALDFKTKYKTLVDVWVAVVVVKGYDGKQKKVTLIFDPITGNRI